LIRTSGDWLYFALTGVACSSASECMIVGYTVRGARCLRRAADCTQRALVERRNGARWTEVAGPKLPGVALGGVWCDSAADCIVVGTSKRRGRTTPFAARWNGSRWTIQHVQLPHGGKSPSVNAVSCGSRRDCVLTGDTSRSGEPVPFTAHWNGGRWMLANIAVPAGTKPSIGGASCAPKSSCVAVGSASDATGQSATLVERWHRSHWSLEPSPSFVTPISAGLSDISCASGSSCMAVGTINGGNTTPLLEQWNGSAWAIEPPPPGTTSSGFNGVSCPTADICAAVGSGDIGSGQFQALTAVSNHGSWSVSRAVPPGAFESVLNGVSCASATACVSVGYYLRAVDQTQLPFAEIWNGTTWSVQAVPPPTGAAGAALSQVSCVSQATCIGVGSYVGSSGNSGAFAASWNGTDWTIQNPPAPAGATSDALSAVSCASAAFCMAVGTFDVAADNSSRPLAESWNGADWSPQNIGSPPTVDSLTAVSCPGTTTCTAVGGQQENQRTVGVAEAWDGSAFSQEQTASVASLYSFSGLSGVWCQSASACVAVGSLVRQTSNGDASKPFVERLSSPALAYVARTATPARSM